MKLLYWLWDEPYLGAYAPRFGYALMIVALTAVVFAPLFITFPTWWNGGLS